MLLLHTPYASHIPLLWDCTGFIIVASLTRGCAKWILLKTYLVILLWPCTIDFPSIIFLVLNFIGNQWLLNKVNTKHYHLTLLWYARMVNETNGHCFFIGRNCFFQMYSFVLWCIWLEMCKSIRSAWRIILFGRENYRPLPLFEPLHDLMFSLNDMQATIFCFFFGLWLFFLIFLIFYLCALYWSLLSSFLVSPFIPLHFGFILMIYGKNRKKKKMVKTVKTLVVQNKVARNSEEEAVYLIPKKWEQGCVDILQSFVDFF